MAALSARGFTLVEALVAMALLGIAAAAILPAFMVQYDANSRAEIRGGAITAAQQVLEDLRLQDPHTMPDPLGSGDPPDQPRQVAVGDQTYDVVARYCERAEFCPPAAPGSRHITVEVSFQGRIVYVVETIYTQLI
jgi:general secretion pathway protein I